MSKNKKTKYCSLDIETSDFDPSNGEILELGMVFFEIEKNKINVLEEWQSTFKPSKDVSPRILGLTGITNEELLVSPKFQEKHEEIQSLVEDCVIVGHNIIFDIRFMESFGIKFSGQKVDTLDLAQMILPTNPSYNLEALMNLLNVSHKDAHRALADAKAALIVLEKLLGYYAGFPDELKSKMQEVFSPSQFPYIYEMLNADLKSESISLNEKKIDLFSSKEIEEALKKTQQIVSFPLGFDYHSYVFGALNKAREKVLLVVPTKQVVYQLWKQNIAYPVFNNREVFDQNAFAKALKESMSPEQRYFLGKILVWKYTNWQDKVLCDLNFSFFGNQYRNLISCTDQDQGWNFETSEKIVAVDYADFISMDISKYYSSRKIVILDINNFEQALTLISSKKVSWNDFIYGLKQIYDPVTATGKKEWADLISEALSQADLFFGLASMNWKKVDPTASQLLVNDQVVSSEQFETIKKAALSFSDKIEKYNKIFKSDRLEQNIANLRLFFEKDPTQIKWVEIFDNRLTFSISPRSLEDISKEKIRPYKKILFTASLGSHQLIKYFGERLGVSDFEEKSIGQQELRKKFEVVITKRQYATEDILGLLNSLDGQVALLLPNGSTLKTFYEQYYQKLGERYKVSAQGYSGGSNKLLDNFGIQEDALLLATDHFMLRHQHRRIKVKTLILSRIPFEQFNHPLFAAQAEKYENQFIDFNIPRALHNFHSLIRTFYGPGLERIYILDQKVHKEYGKYFLDYLKSLPFVELKEI